MRSVLSQARVLLLISLVAALLLALAYQVRLPVTLEMASDAEELYLTRGFYSPEETFNISFRWTSGDAQITLPGLGIGVPLKLNLALHQFRPSPLEPQPVSIALNGRDVISFTPDVTLQAYAFDLPPISDLRGDAVIDLRSDTFTPKDTVPNSTDERALGLFVDQVQVEYSAGLIIPPLMAWGLLIASVLALFGLSRTIGLKTGLSLVLAAGLLLIEIGGVIGYRTFTAHNSPWLAGTLLAAWLIAARLKSTADDRRSLVENNQRSAFRIPRFEIIVVFLLWRILLVLVPIVGNGVQGVRECCPEVLPSPVKSWYDAAFTTWYRWDAIWYGSIAQGGYQYFGEREASNVAFFPGFPLINGAVSHAVGLPVEVSGPIVSSALALIACWLLYRLTRRETGDDATASRAIAYFLAFPAAYYLSVGLSEALYTVAALAAFTFAREGHWGRSGVLSFVAGLTRLHGALLIVPLGFEYLRQNQGPWRSIFKPRAIGVLGGALGVLAFLAYLGLQFGKPLAYFDVQTLFFKGIRAEAFPTFPGTTFANYLFGFLNGVPSTESVAVMGALFFMLLFTVEALARLPKVYGVYMLTVVLFSLTSGDLISLPRFAVPLFPAFMALGLMGKRPWLDRVILITSALLQGVLALMYTKGYWIA